MDVIKTLDLRSGRKLKIIWYDTPANPRTEWDNLGIMAAFHNRYNLGDKHDDRGKGTRIVPFTDADFDSWAEMEKHIMEVEKAIVCLPLYLYDHSGITINTTGFSSRFDSGKVGYIYVTQKKLNEIGIVKGNGDDLLNDEPDEVFHARLKGYLVSEVETYDQYLTGDVYGFQLMEKDAEEDDDPVDSCYGFYGDDLVKNGILDHLSNEDQPINKL